MKVQQEPMMSPALSLKTVLTSLEEEIKVLKAQIKGLSNPRKRLKAFADMEGLWKGKANFSFEEIQQAKTKVRDLLG